MTITDYSRIPWVRRDELPLKALALHGEVTALCYREDGVEWIAPLGTPAPEGVEVYRVTG